MPDKKQEHVCIHEDRFETQDKRIGKVEEKTDKFLTDFWEAFEKRNENLGGKLDDLKDAVDLKASKKDLVKVHEDNKAGNRSVVKQVIAIMGIVLSIIMPVLIALLYLLVQHIGLCWRCNDFYKCYAKIWGNWNITKY
jgi:hypothetical protein